MPTNYVDNVPLRNVKLDARDRHRDRRRRPEVQPDLRQRHGRRLRDAGHAVPQHRVRQGRDLLRRLPQLRRHARHAVPQLREGARFVHARRRPAGARPGRAAERGRHPRRRRSREAQPRLRDRRRRLPPVAARARVPRTHRPDAGGQPAARRRRQHQLRVRPGGPLAAAGSVEAQGHAQRALRARRDVRRLPRRHQRAADQEPARPLGRRLPDRAHVHRMAEQPLRRSPRQRQLRSHASSATASRATCSRTTASRAPRTRSIKDGHPLPIPSEAGRHRRQAAAVVHAPLRRRQRAGAAPDRQGRRRDRQRRALPRAVDVQLLVGRPQEPLLARLLDQPRQEGRVRAAAAPGVGSPAQRPLHDAAGPRHRGGGRPRADHAHRRQHRQRPRLPDRLPRGTHRLGRGARRRSRLRRRAADPRFVLEAHLRRRRQPDDARDDRSRVPGLQLGAAGRLGRSVLDPVQGRRVAGQRLPDAGPALRRAAEHGDRTRAGCRSTPTGASSTRRRTRAGCRSSRT